MRTELAPPLIGPAIAADGAEWTRALSQLRVPPGAMVTLNRGWDLAWERTAWDRSAAEGREHLSIRLQHDEVVIGPRWVPGSDAGCAGCAEVRGRVILDHPLADDLGRPCTVPRTHQPLLMELFAAAVTHLADHPLQPAELYAAGGHATRRHRVPRSVHCPCAAGGRPARTRHRGQRPWSCATTPPHRAIRAGARTACAWSRVTGCETAWLTPGTVRCGGSCGDRTPRSRTAWRSCPAPRR